MLTDLAIELKLTYFGAALTVAFLTQLATMVWAERNRTTPGSTLAYFLYGTFFAYVTAYLTLVLLPQFWPLGGG